MGLISTRWPHGPRSATFIKVVIKWALYFPENHSSPSGARSGGRRRCVRGSAHRESHLEWRMEDHSGSFRPSTHLLVPPAVFYLDKISVFQFVFFCWTAKAPPVRTSPPPQRAAKIVWHVSLSLQSEVVALTFYPHLLLPPVAAGYAAFFPKNFARGRKSGETPGVNNTKIWGNKESLLVFSSLINPNYKLYLKDLKCTAN